MVTSSTRVFEEIGFLKTLEEEGFVKKFGASWHAPANRGKFAIEFREFPQPGINQDYTYHVDRGKMDHLLLKHAESLGSTVLQGVTVKRVNFEGDQAVGVRINVGGQEVDLPAKIVVDASGRGTIIGRQLKTKVHDPLFNQYAVHAWFEGLDKGDDYTRDHIHIYFLSVERGWVWQIPITDEITSVGAVVDKKVFKEFHSDLETYFNAQLTTNANLMHTMRNARRINEFKTEGDYSYALSKFVGNGWVTIGDAARFVDPIFSSGVSIALYSAKYASERIRMAFEQNDFSEEMLKPFETRLKQGSSVWYEFITLYYKLLPLFTRFIANPRYRLQVLQLLQGEVFDRTEVPVLDAMRRFIETVENSPDHLFKSQLTDIPTDITDPTELVTEGTNGAAEAAVAENGVAEDAVAQQGM
jgi:FADH2 O2-dependent halogenase